MIVKVQLSLHSSDGEHRCLIYDKGRRFEYEGICGEDIAGAMKGRAKAFFELERESDGGFLLGDEVSDPGW
jgi:hypothetical protein